MCAKDDLIRRKSLLSTSTSNYVNTFSSDFAFSFAITISIRPLIARGNNILSLIAFIISYRLFADKLNIQQSLLDRATVVLIIISVNKTQLSLISGDVAAYTLLARFIPTTKIRDPLLKTLENAAKSRILLACADRRTRQCYLTICAILKHYNFNIYVSLATDTLHLLLKGLVIKMLDFITSLKRFNNKRAFTEAIIQQLIAIVSPLFVSKAPFALHFIRAVYNLVTLAQYKSYDEDTLAYIQGALERMNPYSTKLLLSKVAANIAISNFTHAAAVQEFEHRDNRRQSRTVTDDRKHIAYIGAFSKILLFNNNRQIDNTTRMLSILQAFKFYDLSTIIRLVHLVPRDLPDLTTYTTMSYYVNNYID
ncbi:hypothetical protein HBH90_066430 [Parastagonospora nodorum]|nr:hypothetical protein HBI02_057060 [Parastagonospora nodorum]KAH4386802.1 hypothetical protein HBH94_045560 [Parastagonospora nodorum]KAH4471256.1 hypothetical protein HBH90_066430 [Parastagonospora nodorum]KAH4503533.1 hypothetical protein HBH88_065360 [Parastagonospora nodorum]KAH4642840.1 hypothetical protein HBH80_246080 [Parastagonospora nodorum]